MTTHTLVPVGSFDDTLDSDIGGEDVQLEEGCHRIVLVEKKRKKRRNKVGRKRSSDDEDGEDAALQRRRLVLILASLIPFVLACVTLALVCYSGAGKRTAESDEMATASSFQASYFPALARVAIGGPPAVTKSRDEEPSTPQSFAAVPAVASSAQIFANWGNIPV